MSYNERLNKLIDESGLKIITISQKCKSLGVDVKPSYISILKNNPEKVASDNVSRALAIACGASDPDILIIENYIDNAPKAMLKTFDVLKEIIIEVSSMFITNELNEAEEQAIKDNISNMAIADFISFVNSNYEKKFKKSANSNNIQVVQNIDDTKFIARLSEPQGFLISDNAMAPIIQKGDKVNIEITSLDKLQTGDIVCYYEKSRPKDLIIRKCFFLNEEKTIINMCPLSSSAKSHTYRNSDKIVILGKVTRVIHNI